MSKLKLVLLIILTSVVVIFAYDNRQTAPAIKFFTFQLGEVPTYLLVYLSLVVGAVIGWLSHGLRIRRKRREAQTAQTASAQHRQEAEAGQGGQQAQ
jgi:uncharacterized integral membrane protein